MLGRIRRIHPGLILASLDAFGFVVASYLSVVELEGGVPACGALHGCETVATSPYSHIAGVPVAVYGVALSTVLFVAAIAWWRTGSRTLLAIHYGLSLFGTIWEGYFIYLQVTIIKAVCIYCVAYGVSLILRFLIALVVWIRRDRVAAGEGW